MLNVSNLSSNYGNVRAVEHLNLRVETGQIVALIGANGSGKSTTMKTMAGHHTAAGGSVTFDGEDVTRLQPHRVVRRGLAFLPERPMSILPPLTVEENLKLGRSSRRGNSTASLARCYSLFPLLKDRRRQHAGTLSGGEQQMLAFARVLMTDPRMLMIDSPAIGLSPSMTDAVYEVIVQLKRDGLTILLIEQSAALALVVSDYAYLLHRGKNQLEGPSEKLRESQELVDAYLG